MWPRTALCLGRQGRSMISIHDLLEVAIRVRASDLIVKAGSPPAVRVDGRVQRTDLPSISPEETRELAYEIMFSAGREALLLHPDSTRLSGDEADAEEKMSLLRSRRELDMVFTIPGLARVRANLFL